MQATSFKCKFMSKLKKHRTNSSRRKVMKHELQVGICWAGTMQWCIHFARCRLFILHEHIAPTAWRVKTVQVASTMNHDPPWSPSPWLPSPTLCRHDLHCHHSINHHQNHHKDHYCHSLAYLLSSSKSGIRKNISELSHPMSSSNFD